jgi:hypothetical protein
MRVSVDLEGFDALARKVKVLDQRVEAMLRHLVRFYSRAIEREAKRNAPVDEGELRGSFGTLSAGLMAAVFNTADHAKPIEFGADAHEIGPRNAERLVFFWESQGRMFYGRPGQSVDHPGNKAYNYFRDAIRREWPQLKQAAIKNLKRVLGSA